MAAMWGCDGKGLEGKGWGAQSSESLALSFCVHFCQWGQAHFPCRAMGALR